MIFFFTSRQHKISTSCVWWEERSVQHFPAPTSTIRLWCWVPSSTQSWFHPHSRVFHAYKGLEAAKKEALYVGIWMRSSLCETGPVVLHRGICPFTEISYRWVLLRATLFICAEAVWLSGELFIDVFCLSASVFYLIDLFSVTNRWGISKILFSNILLPGSGMFRVKPWCLLRCSSPWASHELCVWPLQLTFWTGFQKMWFSILSGFSSSSDCRLYLMRPKTSFPLLSIFTFLNGDRSGGALVLYRITSVMWAQLFDTVGHEVRWGLHTCLWSGLGGDGNWWLS